MEISVITCTHNPRMQTLQRVWAALERQSLARDQWEYILVDNASRPPLSEPGADLNLPAARYMREDNLGLTHARLAGIAAARGDILVFVDDDCLLEPDYLHHTLAVFREHPFIGSVGGYGRAEYEVPPPDWMSRTLRQYHLDMQLPESGQALLYARVLKQFGAWFPIGAGLAIRRPLAEQYAEFVRNDPVALGFGRIGNLLSGGEDLDMGISVMGQGFAIGKSRDLQFVHVVPAFRLELDYMLRLLYMSQYSTERLLVYRGWKKAKPLTPVPAWRGWKKRLGLFQRKSPPEDLCWQALARGRKDGLAGVPPNPGSCT